MEKNEAFITNRVNQLLGTNYQDKVDWNWISAFQKLSEDFIREFQDKVKWDYISTYQKLSEGFIREFQDRVDWGWISECQNYRRASSASSKTRWIGVGFPHTKNY